MENTNGKNERFVRTQTTTDGDDSLIVVIPHSDTVFSLLVPREFIDQVDMFSKLIGISRADFVRFAVYELVHHYDNGCLKKLADGE